MPDPVVGYLCFWSINRSRQKGVQREFEMSETVRVSLPDGSAREFAAGTTVLGVAEAIGPRLARDTVAGMVNGDLVDLRTPITSDADLRIVTAKDPEAGDVIRHSAEHVLADAVKRLWPGTPIDAGRQDHSEKYQYDFRFPRAFKPEDFENRRGPRVRAAGGRS
jgi:threonyl-tRNA synthetase